MAYSGTSSDDSELDKESYVEFTRKLVENWLEILVSNVDSWDEIEEDFAKTYSDPITDELDKELNKQDDVNYYFPADKKIIVDKAVKLFYYKMVEMAKEHNFIFIEKLNSRYAD